MPEALLDDLALLPSFDEATVLKLLTARYAANCIYTRVNAMLLAGNPYCELGLYSGEASPLRRRLWPARTAATCVCRGS